MNLQQTSCLLLLKALHCLGKLNGGRVVAILSVGSSALVDAFRLFLVWYFALSATLLSLNSKKPIPIKDPKKTVTDSLSYPNNKGLS
jgi:hypothetical protein